MPLGPTHDRITLTYGVDSFDVYLKTQASQDVRRKANTVFVLTGVAEPQRILGYFTLGGKETYRFKPSAAITQVGLLSPLF